MFVIQRILEVEGKMTLLDQSKVITRISDRLQKKLDHANQKIKSQNVEIQKKNKGSIPPLTALKPRGGL